ncbi:MAG: hypothetical protein K2H47_11230 [Muribaculaceae bacterium]|nr:hypothetical protein [Muribaculaceae bacterium]
MEKEKLSNLLDCIYELEGLVHLALTRDDNPSGLAALIAGKAAAVAERSAELTGIALPETVPAPQPLSTVAPELPSVAIEPSPVDKHVPEPVVEPESVEDDYEPDDEYEGEEGTLYVAPDDEEEDTVEETTADEDIDEEEVTEEEEDTVDEEESLKLPPIEEALGFRPDLSALKATAPVRPAQTEAPAPVKEPVRPVRADIPPRRSVNDEAESTRRSLNDTTARGRLVFSLNDRFRFRRSLFNGNDAQFTAALSEVAALENYYEAEDYFYGTLQWQPDNQEVVDFMHIIQRYFES